MATLIPGHGPNCRTAVEARDRGYAWGQLFRGDEVSERDVDELIEMFKVTQAGEFAEIWANSVRAGRQDKAPPELK